MRISPAYLVIGALSWPLLRVAFRPRVDGLAHLPAGGCVVAPNHSSNLDPWALGFGLFPRRQVRFMGKSELFAPVLGAVLRAAGAFPVRRGQGDAVAIGRAVELARSGEIVAIYPQGTRAGGGEAPRPRTGAARVALEARVPLVPVAITGTDRWRRLARVRVRFGRPVPLDDLRDHEARDAARVATERLVAAIGELGGGR